MDPLHHSVSPQQLKNLIRQKATELGFDACGFARAGQIDDVNLDKYDQWLRSNHHGEMTYMERNRSLRIDPCELLPGASSVVVLALNYHQKDYQPESVGCKVSQYAVGVDYHHVIKEKLYHLLDYLKVLIPETQGRVFTDSAPVMERYWAWKAGVGLFGKNSCIILPRKGSYFFLAEILTDLVVPEDTPLTLNPCGNCTRCVDACPTSAILPGGGVDARKCISYLTIELKDNIPDELKKMTSGYIFGCDICQQVCPHNNRFARATREEKFLPIHPVSTWNDQDWENMDKPTFKKSFVKTKSPISRVRFEKLKATIQDVLEQKD